jgi:hypothetical protein
MTVVNIYGYCSSMSELKSDDTENDTLAILWVDEWPRVSAYISETAVAFQRQCTKRVYIFLLVQFSYFSVKTGFSNLVICQRYF